MKLAIATTAAALAFGVTAASAASWTFEDVDTNSDGTLTMQEVETAYPGIDQVQFGTFDANGDQVIDEGEFASLKQNMDANSTSKDDT
ncbi:hypothetical protein FDP22_07090 [Paroceanicella profunda]|uniref:EF-hand domain-containing protein n=1 Tax=Paroceanicella profunda TaxID=2579971 RepID=A0A5B8FWM2_9RHOB|nr:hypothetical protein [Paroceanicella profunda]QDL91570.1 hypothetical protein FDP22_07090 [Paroceanicella profunda]